MPSKFQNRKDLKSLKGYLNKVEKEIIINIGYGFNTKKLIDARSFYISAIKKHEPNFKPSFKLSIKSNGAAK